MALVKKNYADPQQEQAHLNATSLLQELDSEDPLRRRDAVRALPDVLDDEMIVTLTAKLQTETNGLVMDAIALALIESPSPTSVDCLIPLLRSDNALLRNLVIDTLSKLPSLVEEHMGSLLDDEDPDVRIFAINIMESLRSEQVPDWLRKVITEDEHVNVVATAIDLLAELGSPDMCDDIQKCKLRFIEEPYIEFVADRVLSSLRC